MNNTIDPLNIIKSTKGKFFGISYTNKMGETKSYTCRMGVRKHLRGGEKYFVPDSVTVYSVTGNNRGYKTFVLEQINSIKVGTTYWVAGWSVK
jgi:hypothetical protein